MIDQMPIDPVVKQSFENFMQTAAQYNNMEAGFVREGMKGYNDTYYYDYYLMKDLPEY